MDLSSWIAFWARWSPARTAIRFDGTEISYAELEETIGVWARELRDRGLERGDRLAYLGPNRPELLELFFACSRIGAIFVPLNARMPPSELSVFIEHSEPRLLLADDDYLDTARSSTRSTCEVGPLQNVSAAGPLQSSEAGNDDPVLLAYTSGTAGTPKGVVLTSGALLANAMNARAVLDLSSSDHVLTVVPMFHVGGLNILTSPALVAGATVSVHRQFDPAAFLNAIALERPTLTVIVPPISLAATSHGAWSGTDASSLRAVLIGATMVPDKAMLPWFERGVPVCQVYGLTETCPTATVVPVEDAERMAASAGRPVATCTVTIVDPGGAELPRGEIGEVLLSGSTVFREYWRNPVATAAAFAGDRLRTGDAGYVDDEGFLHIVERLKDIIVVGSSNVYPADVEQVLVTDPAIREASVVGRPDEELGEVPVAFIVGEPGLTEKRIRALLDERLAGYKHPRDLFFVEGLPKTSLGKVQRAVLRDWATAGSASAPGEPAVPA